MQGTDAWAPVPEKRDGDFARMYLATGLVPLGKSQLSEYGFSPSAEHPRLGPVRSPWNTNHTAGASSAGSAAMVAAGVVPIAHANDGGGSIRIPAAVNGLVGLKPTRDRLAQDATMRQMPVRIISDGVVTRSVRDTAAFFREAEKVYRALHLPPIGDLTRPGRRRLRIGVHTEGVGRGANAGGHRAHPQGRRGARGARPPRRAGGRARCAPSFPDDFLLYWSSLALLPPPQRAPDARSRRGSPRTWTTSATGWTPTPAATCTGCPARSAGCAAAAGRRRSSSRATTWR